jgi:hypothetical protein
MSNCHIHAEGKFRAGDAEWVCFRRTRRSKFAIWYDRQHPAFRTLVQFAQPLIFFPIGIVLRTASGLLMHISEFLMSGGWLHSSWITWQGAHWEYVPEDCPPRWFPPLVFDGIERTVEPKGKE